jgi:hypothetical protein
MLNRVNKVLIGKNISRTASLVVYGSGGNLAEGEIVVLDKNKTILTAGSTVTDSDVIYVAEGTGSTYSYVTAGTGTSVSGVRRMIVSEPIKYNEVKAYAGRSYTAAVEQVVTIVGSSFAPVVGAEYTLRVVYKDTFERPGQLTYTYRVIAATTSVTDLWTAFVAKINTHAARRVVATTPASNLVLTGRVAPWDYTDTVDAIDEYYQISFRAFLYSKNFGDTTITYTTSATPGNGTWQRVRDAEKLALGYKGITNKIWFPVTKPTMRTVASATYNSIIIEHAQQYLSPDNQYLKNQPCTTEIYIPTAAGQMNDVLAVLNPWMLSIPNGFDVVTF